MSHEGYHLCSQTVVVAPSRFRVFLINNCRYPNVYTPFSVFHSPIQFILHHDRTHALTRCRQGRAIHTKTIDRNNQEARGRCDIKLSVKWNEAKMMDCWQFIRRQIIDVRCLLLMPHTTKKIRKIDSLNNTCALIWIFFYSLRRTKGISVVGVWENLHRRERIKHSLWISKSHSHFKCDWLTFAEIQSRIYWSMLLFETHFECLNDCVEATHVCQTLASQPPNAHATCTRCVNEWKDLCTINV